MIIVSVLSLINMTKYLFKVVLQNISLLQCYLYPKSILNITSSSSSCSRLKAMSNVYVQKCLYQQNYARQHLGSKSLMKLAQTNLPGRCLRNEYLMLIFEGLIRSVLFKLHVASLIYGRCSYFY